jgi:hypothetical protein
MTLTASLEDGSVDSRALHSTSKKAPRRSPITTKRINSSPTPPSPRTVKTLSIHSVHLNLRNPKNQTPSLHVRHIKRTTERSVPSIDWVGRAVVSNHPMNFEFQCSRLINCRLFCTSSDLAATFVATTCHYV